MMAYISAIAVMTNTSVVKWRFWAVPQNVSVKTLSVRLLLLIFLNKYVSFDTFVLYLRYGIHYDIPMRANAQ